MATKSSYKDRIQESPEAKDQKALAYQVKQAELKCQADILATEQSVAEAENSVECAKAAMPLDMQTIVDAEIILESAQDGLKRAIRIKAELFPASK